jgi:hypothetical protein
MFKELEDKTEPKQAYVASRFTADVWQRQAQANKAKAIKAQPTKPNGGKQKGAGKDSKKGKKGGNKDKKGSGPICVDFNSAKGCRYKGCKRQHICSFRNQDGSFCNSTRHGKANHVVE